MPLSWNEIRNRAITFAREWSDAARERAEAQTFWNECFNVFGIRRRVVASFEEPVRNLGGATDFIDLFWKGKLIAEHKSRGGNLDKAHTQAMGYIQDLHNEGREDEIPRYLLVSDFARFALHDLEAPDAQPGTVEFDLTDLPRNIRHFAFIPGYETRRLDPEDPANFDATRRLANLHDRLEDGRYGGHDLERFMVRILFFGASDGRADVRHRDRRVAGPHRRGGTLAHGSPNKPRALRPVRWLARDRTTNNVAAHPPRQCPADRLGRRAAKRSALQ
jgi:hypothetical protein